MYFHVFKIRCITNLHVGSGDINYNVIDKEVEKDPITGLPIIHASGIKGALRKHFKDMDKSKLEEIFGAEGKGDGSKPGSYRFMDAHLLARPLRAYSDETSSDKVKTPSCVNVTTAEIMQNFLNTVNDFSNDSCDKTLPSLNFASSAFLATEEINIEGETASVLTDECKWIKNLIGANYAFAINISDYDLPIIARNHLENGISTNLWYEEFVPHGSVFYMVILTPNEKCDLIFDKPVQIGGNASVGYGFTKIEEIDLGKL